MARKNETIKAQDAVWEGDDPTLLCPVCGGTAVQVSQNELPHWEDYHCNCGHLWHRPSQTETQS